MNETDYMTTELYIDDSNGNGKYNIPPVINAIMLYLPLATFLFVQISGLSPIIRILKNKSTGDMTPFPFVSLYTNCAPWTLYAILGISANPGLITTLIANATGTVAGIVYTAIFALYTEQSMLKYYVGSGIVLSIILSTPLWTPFIGLDPMTVIGIYGLVSIAVCFSSPLAAIGTVIKQKSTESMSFVMSLAMFLSTLTWFLYGWFIVSDFFIWSPNTVGLLGGIIQLSLFVIYPSKKKEGNDFVIEVPHGSEEVASLSPTSLQSDPGVAV